MIIKVWLRAWLQYLPCRAITWCSAGPYSLRIPRSRCSEPPGNIGLRPRPVRMGGRKYSMANSTCPPMSTTVWSSPLLRTFARGGQRDRPHRGFHAQAPAHPTETLTGWREQGAGRQTSEDRYSPRVHAQARNVAQAFSYATGAHAAELPHLVLDGRVAGFREVRRSALHDGASLADRADEPSLARLAQRPRVPVMFQSSPFNVLNSYSLFFEMIRFVIFPTLSPFSIL